MVISYYFLLSLNALKHGIWTCKLLSKGQFTAAADPQSRKWINPFTTRSRVVRVHNTRYSTLRLRNSRHLYLTLIVLNIRQKYFMHSLKVARQTNLAFLLCIPTYANRIRSISTVEWLLFFCYRTQPKPAAATTARFNSGDGKRSQRPSAAGDDTRADPTHCCRSGRVNSTPSATSSRATSGSARDRLWSLLRLQTLQGGLPIAYATAGASISLVLHGPGRFARCDPRRPTRTRMPHLSRGTLPHSHRVPTSRGNRWPPSERVSRAPARAARATHPRDGGRRQSDHAAGGPRRSGVQLTEGPERQLLRARTPLPDARRAPSGQRRPLILLYEMYSYYLLEPLALSVVRQRSSSLLALNASFRWWMSPQWHFPSYIYLKLVVV